LSDSRYRLHRVKVYVMMEDKQWKNVGTGQISSKYSEQLQGMCLLVHSLSDGSPIMECKIHPNVPYQKQQGKIIICCQTVKSIHLKISQSYFLLSLKCQARKKGWHCS
uniref:Uncharacterized protein n=1 Tax=Mus spicilegus TaxID=10103 RepID=A0A8C6GLJ7_MUSSI